MNQEKNIHSFFEKRVLRPSKEVNYTMANPVESPIKKSVKMLQRQGATKENKISPNETIQASDDLSRQLIHGKTLNRFFDKKAPTVSAKPTVITETIDPLIPDYENCHVGYAYYKSKLSQSSIFGKREKGALVFHRTSLKLLEYNDSDIKESFKVSKIKMSKVELDDYLKSQFSQEILERPCINAIYFKLTSDSGSQDDFQWNDKYAPFALNEILGSTNRDYAASLLEYIKNWRPAVKKTRKKTKGCKVDDLDDFIASGDDSEFEEGGASKHQLLIGPTGIGKTALVMAVAKEAQVGIIEIHTGMKRSGKELISILGETISSKLVGGVKKEDINESWLQKQKNTVPQRRRKRVVINSSGDDDDADQEVQKPSLRPRDEPATTAHVTRKKSGNTENPSQKGRIKSFFEPKRKGGIASFFKPVNDSLDTEEVVVVENEYSTLDKPQKRHKKELINSSQEDSADLDQELIILNSEKVPVRPKNNDGIKSFFEPKKKGGIASFFKPVKDSMETEDLIVIGNKSRRSDPTDHSSMDEAFKSEKLQSAAKETVQGMRIVSGRKTIILLDSVDIITDEDKGFWNGVSTLFAIKNPFTQSNLSIPPNILGELLNSVEIFHMDPPDVNELTCYLIIMLLNEGILVEQSVIHMICEKFNNDIRKITLFLQLWVKNYQSKCKPDNSNECFIFNSLDASFFSTYFDSENERDENWRPCLMPNSLESAAYTLETLSKIDHRHIIENFDYTPSDIRSLYPNVGHTRNHPSKISQKDMACHFEMLSYTTEVLQNPSKSFLSSDLKIKKFTNGSFLKDQLNNTADLLFWDNSISVPRIFITEVLPWLSILLRNSTKIPASQKEYSQNGRARRSKRKVTRIFENELTQNQFEGVAKTWFTQD